MSSVKVKSSDNVIFELPIEVAKKSITLSNMLDDIEVSENEIPLPNVDGKTMNTVVEFIKFDTVVLHKKKELTEEEKNQPRDEEKPKEGFQDWEQKFIDSHFKNGDGSFNQDLLFKTILAANYLDIKQLLDLSCKSVAYQIKGKTPEEIRKTFQIKNDFTEEEVEKIKKENEYVLDD